MQSLKAVNNRVSITQTAFHSSIPARRRTKWEG